jgi:hypothetical protein
VEEGSNDHIEAGAAECLDCATVYPIREGIGLFLTPDLSRKDLWEEAESQLMSYLREHPNLESRLMHGPVDALGPADQYFRAMVLEERGKYAQAATLEKRALQGIHTSAFMECWDSQVEYVIEQLVGGEGPIVDLASGRCYLVEQMVQRVDRPIIATDFSPRVLRRDRAWLKTIGALERVSMLAFDARRTPFRAKSVATLTTNLGLQNIETPGTLFRELRRMVDGRLLAVSSFYLEDDKTNAAALHEYGLTAFQREALDDLASAGWEARAANIRRGEARPTPTSDVLEGAGIDAFPLTDTVLEWCVLDAR